MDYGVRCYIMVKCYYNKVMAYIVCMNKIRVATILGEGCDCIYTYIEPWEVCVSW